MAYKSDYSETQMEKKCCGVGYKAHYWSHLRDIAQEKLGEEGTHGKTLHRRIGTLVKEMPTIFRQDYTLLYYLKESTQNNL